MGGKLEENVVREHLAHHDDEVAARVGLRSAQTAHTYELRETINETFLRSKFSTKTEILITFFPRP